MPSTMSIGIWCLCMYMLCGELGGQRDGVGGRRTSIHELGGDGMDGCKEGGTHELGSASNGMDKWKNRVTHGLERQVTSVPADSVLICFNCLCIAAYGSNVDSWSVEVIVSSM